MYNRHVVTHLPRTLPSSGAPRSSADTRRSLFGQPAGARITPANSREGVRLVRARLGTAASRFETVNVYLVGSTSHLPIYPGYSVRKFTASARLRDLSVYGHAVAGFSR